MATASQLGFGIMRLPQNNGEVDWEKTKEMIDEYMQGDFCYFDLHPAYMNGKAQDILRELVVKRYPRNSYQIANKMPYYGIKSFRDYEIAFFKELAACGVQHFDYYMLHALTQDVYEMHERMGGFHFLQEKKSEGRIGKIGISFHDKPELLEEILENHPEIEFVQLQINFLDWESSVVYSRANYEVACKYHKQIMVMEPIKGGSLANPVEIENREYSSEQLVRYSLEFVARLPEISVILSGMSELIHVKENRETISNCSEENNLEIYQKLREQISKNNKIACTGCGYCMRECPKKISVPGILTILNNSKQLGKHDRTFLGRYGIIYNSYIRDKGKASDCIKCGKCELRCPQKLKIRAYMQEAQRLFEDRKSENMNYYTTERSIQILIYLLKEHNIKKIVISPGCTNVEFAYSVQQDGFFEIYSAADERSAAYIACGLAEESGETVVLSCTGATASRNYIPALTEAFYRKIPILAVTSAQPSGKIGHNVPQVIDRTTVLNDIVKMSVQTPAVKDFEDEWACEIMLNKAILEVEHRGKGPVHINLVSTYTMDFSARNLPTARVIKRVSKNNELPEMPIGKIGIFCGAHSKWSRDLTEKVDKFCEKYKAVVIYDHTSNYCGKYGVLASLLSTQEKRSVYLSNFEMVIHIGNISGAYLNLNMNQVWRVNPDGAVCDTFRKLRYVFEMEEEDFFEQYLKRAVFARLEGRSDADGRKEYKNLLEKMPELPFSNAWIAQQTAGLLPKNAVLHLGILNTLRNWNFFEIPEAVKTYSNTGGFGIDGCVSTLIGASLANPEKLYFGIIGDLAFFYDMNVLGNRHVGANIRLLLINNGGGIEFKNYNHIAARFGEDANDYIAAMGHYGNKSAKLVKNYAENLGFRYLSASNKEEYLQILPEIVSEQISESPMLIEIFTNDEEESDALSRINSLNGKADGNSSANSKTVDKPLRIAQQKDKKKVVLWGTGYHFSENLSKVEEHCAISYVCDNNQQKWGKEIVPGIKCISPDELAQMENIFVVLMIEKTNIAFQIANQLLDIGIDSFDVVDNWLQYAD